MTYIEILSYNIDRARESKIRDFMFNCTLVHEFNTRRSGKILMGKNGNILGIDLMSTCISIFYIKVF